MSYEVFILRRAQKTLSKIEKHYRENIQEKIRSLGANPRPHQCKKLSGRNGWRIRKGDYRIIYEVNDADKEVTILDIGHRRDVYR